MCFKQDSKNEQYKINELFISWISYC